MKRSIYIALCLGGLIAIPAMAQKDTTLTRTVVVENEYNPHIMDANKINMLPAIEEPKVSKKEIEYANTQRPITRFPLQPMPNLATNPTQPDATCGWVNVGYGNYGNLLGRVSYLYRINEEDHLHLAADFDGQNGKMELPESKEKWNSRFYQTKLGALYTHQFETTELGVKGNYGLQTFNYLPYEEQPSDKQNHTLGNIGVYLRSTVTDNKWQYKGELDYSYFGQDYLYWGNQSMNGRSESCIHAMAGAIYQLSSENKVGLNIDMRHYGYSEDKQTNGLTPFENFTLFHFNPYYSLTNETLRLRVGGHIHWVTGFDNGFSLAPDVLVELPFSDRYVFYVEGTGGITPNSFRRMNALTPYWSAPQQLNHTHNQLDATSGFRANLAQGVSLHMFAGFELSSNDLLVKTFDAVNNELYTSGPNEMTQGKSHSFKAGISSKYTYQNLIDLSAQIVYRGWGSDDKDKPFLYTKPALDFRLNAIGKIQKLNWELGYQYTSRYKGKMDAINDLYLSLSYPLIEQISVWAKADNLLNSSYQYYWSYPTEKINFMVGAAFRF